MSSFTTPLVVSLMPSGVDWRLEQPFTYRIGSKYSNQYIRVPKGFVTDFASIPKFLFWLLPWWAKFCKAPVLHDWLYKEKKIMDEPIAREDADRIFLDAMRIDWRNHKSGRFIARIEYTAVRWFGFFAWEGNN